MEEVVRWYGGTVSAAGSDLAQLWRMAPIGRMRVALSHVGWLRVAAAPVPYFCTSVPAYHRPFKPTRKHHSIDILLKRSGEPAKSW